MTNDSQMADQTAPRPSVGQATRVWATIGLLSFGGPAGQIALMHRMVVEERRWISESRFLHALNFCMLLPGPEAQQLATYIGWLLHGVRGGIIAGTLFILPGLAVILGLSTIYAVFQDTGWLSSLFFGLKAAVLAIVVDAVIRIGRRALKGYFAVLLAAAAFIAIYVFRVPFPLIIASAAILGFWRSGAEHGSTPPEADGLQGAHDATTANTLRVIVAWGALWLAPIILFALVAGWGSIYPQLALFFSWLAVVTFGGAYAVLAYVAEAAVSSFGWLSPGEMLDGLALAETTPGPLILVLSFVGYLAAFRAATGLDPVVAGLIGGLLTAWVTFVPCFLWIFLGAPYVERLRGHIRLSGALSAVTAAVVGVILNLALWFGIHVLFREVTTVKIGPASPAWPVWSTVDPWAAGLLAVAIAALFVLRIGLVATLVVCAGLGAGIRLLG